MEFGEQLHTLEEVLVAVWGLGFALRFWTVVASVFCGLLLDCSCGFWKAVVSALFGTTSDW